MSAYTWSEEEATRYLDCPSSRTPPFGPMALRPSYITVWVFDARNTDGCLPKVPRDWMSMSSTTAREKSLCIFDMGGSDALVAIPLLGLTTIPAGTNALQLIRAPIVCNMKLEDFKLSIPDPFALRYIKYLYYNHDTEAFRVVDIAQTVVYWTKLMIFNDFWVSVDLSMLRNNGLDELMTQASGRDPVHGEVYTNLEPEHLQARIPVAIRIGSHFGSGFKLATTCFLASPRS
ncbi:hypothetical protein LTR56_002882 [Elasticomyces elasticus]|nr:hypothetical protein LTR56_002882 [Elasticomyces elasticus]KAK4930669.1 hypothetical protein LTR49_002756 [Elasticomyces elasticus]KAK5759892.1 hypothetical protein LTS12_009939 [Elasticomyces elasticus]